MLWRVTEEDVHMEKKWTVLIMEKTTRLSTMAENTPGLKKLFCIGPILRPGRGMVLLVLEEGGGRPRSGTDSS